MTEEKGKYNGKRLRHFFNLIDVCERMNLLLHIIIISLQVQERHDCTEFPHEQYKQFVTIPK